MKFPRFKHVGHRGAFLLFLALLDLLYGYSLFTGHEHSVNLVLPWLVWAIIWSVAGVCLLVGSIVHNDRIFFALATTIKAMWAFVFLHLWIYDHAPMAWASMVIWAALAALVVVVSFWPEPPKRGEVWIRRERQKE
jgi:hypothetical protein